MVSFLLVDNFFLFFVFFENVHLENRRKFWNKLTLNRWCCFKTFYWRGKEERKHVQNTLSAPCFCNRLVWKIAIFNCEYLGDAWFNWVKLHIMFIWIISNTFHYNWTVITKVEILVNLTFIRAFSRGRSKANFGRLEEKKAIFVSWLKL